MLPRVAIVGFILCAPSLRAQSPPQIAPASENSCSYTVQSAPETLVWPAFLDQVVAAYQRAADLERPRNEDTPQQTAQKARWAKAVRARPQTISGLNDAAWAIVSSVASRFAAQMGDWRTKATSLGETQSRNVPLTPEQRSESAAHWNARSAIISEAIAQLRESLGAVRFSQLDRRIREHVVPRLACEASSTVQPVAR